MPQEGHIDFTGAQMVLTLRLIAVAVSYQDGAAPAGTAPRSYTSKKRLVALPSPLHFASYLFAAGNLLAGPFFEAADFFDYVERRVRAGGCCGDCGVVVGGPRGAATVTLPRPHRARGTSATRASASPTRWCRACCAWPRD